MRLVFDRKVGWKIENSLEHVPYPICTAYVSCRTIPDGEEILWILGREHDAANLGPDEELLTLGESERESKL